MKRVVFTGLTAALACAALACGSNSGSDGGDGNDPSGPDAMVPEGCIPNSTQCNNCIDDDGDGLIDGFDAECTGPLDDLEGSFATGIPGDNVDPVKQDCFFDGNSGQGNDGCNIHVCCLLQTCPPEYADSFDPGACGQSQQCIDTCGAITPPGCDCFGCCTICNDTGCYEVLTNPAVAPDCDEDVLDDPALCPRCDGVDECGPGDCDPASCILCPGQTQDDLPPECVMQECPGDLTVCTGNADCNADQFCSAGCCIAVVD